MNEKQAKREKKNTHILALPHAIEYQGPWSC